MIPNTYKDYNRLDIRKVEAKLAADLLIHNKHVRIKALIITLVLLLIFKGHIIYWAKFAIAVPYTKYAQTIDTSIRPKQTKYNSGRKSTNTFIYKSLINNNMMKITPQAHIVISGKVVAYNHDFVIITKFFDSAALYDLGLAWGDMANTKILKEYVKAYSSKTEVLGTRAMHTSFKDGMPIDENYARTHLFHCHLVPANRNIMAALLRIRRYKDVQIEGELINMAYHNPKTNETEKYKTNISEFDTEETNPNGSTGEIIYVTSVQIGNKIYK